MVVLRFEDERTRRDCCHPVHMQRRWGSARALQITHRLQQLDAMTSLADLAFLPFDSTRVDNRVEVDIDEDHVLLLDVDPATSDAVVTLIIRGVTTRSFEAIR